MLLISVNPAAFAQNISSITTTFVNVEEKFGELIETQDLSDFEEFDRAGLLMKKTRYRADKTEAYTRTYEYELGKMILDKEVGTEGEIRHNIIFTYDGDILKEKKNYRSSGVLEDKTVFNDAGKELVRDLFSSDGSLRSKHKFHYDEQGKLKRHIEYDSKGQIYWDMKYEYSPDDSIVIEIKHNKTGALSSTVKSTYDTSGNLTFWVWLEPDGSIFRSRVNKYNGKGLITYESQLYGDGTQQNRNEVEYLNDLKVEQRFYDKDEKPTSIHIFEYDENNNIKSRFEYDCTYKFGERQKNLSRKIIYKYEYYQ